MISISVDEAYAFDYLSILFIKKNINSDCYDYWVDCYSHIENQLGKKLVITNIKIFYKAAKPCNRKGTLDKHIIKNWGESKQIV
jgi:predicted phosphohydrolase